MPDLAFRATAFLCPMCKIFSQQTWAVALEQRPSQIISYSDLQWATCLNCKERTIWFKEVLVAPVSSSAPAANPDMPEDVRIDFDEARDVAERSPRSAAALLRLCIQKLCIVLGESGKHLDKDIASLVGNGLPVQIQQAFDAIRIVGNSQIHPDNQGVDLRSDPSAVSLLFRLVNLIVENQISLPKRTSEFYEGLPESSRRAVELRTQRALKNGG